MAGIRLAVRESRLYREIKPQEIHGIDWVTCEARKLSLEQDPGV
jgi:hypothetical protein